MRLPDYRPLESDPQQIKAAIDAEFPDFAYEVQGIYTNEQLLKDLGSELFLDSLGIFHEEMEAFPELFRMALSELSDKILYSRENAASDQRWRLHDTRASIGLDERARIYQEMGDTERQQYEGLFGNLVLSYCLGANMRSLKQAYWTEEVERLQHQLGVLLQFRLGLPTREQ